MNLLGFLRDLGRCFQLPISILPVAALLLRMGDPSLLNLPALVATGGAIFDHLPLLFALGIACGWSRGHSGEATLAGGVGYLVLTQLLEVLAPHTTLGVFGGILAGLTAGFLFNHCSQIRLWSFLAFFSGKRLVPILTALICTLWGYLCSLIWPTAQEGLNLFSRMLLTAGPLGAALFGLLNRLLLPTGLHQVLNNWVWYQVGSFTDAQGHILQGDMSRFYGGDTSAGAFMTGFYPIMLFGLPSACLAMIAATPKKDRARTATLCTSLALTSMVTGVTEPLEFSFMFTAPLLYLFHALLTGCSLFLASLLEIHAGFSFSASLIDLLLITNLPASQHLWRLLPLGLLFALAYGLIFYTAIRFFNLETPGASPASAQEAEESKPTVASSDAARRIDGLLEALGGCDNLVDLQACITRLRLTLQNPDRLNREALMQLGAKGVIQVEKDRFQVVMGAEAEAICDEMRQRCANTL